MIAYKHLTIEELSYVQEIILAQNKLRTKLPYILSYSGDKHFQELSMSNNSIKQQRLQNLIPFRSKQIMPYEYLPKALYALNTGQYNSCVNNEHHELTYRGYLRLISTQRNCFSGGSQVNVTLFHRLSLDHQLNHYINIQNQPKPNDRKADSIIGMLLFLQSVKQSVLIEHNPNPANESSRDRFAEKGEQAKRKRTRKRRIFDQKPSNNYQYSNVQKVNFNHFYSLPKTYASDKGSLNNYARHLNPQYCSTSNNYNNYEETQRNKVHYEYKQNPQERQGYKQSSVIEKFSSEQNVWKNIAQRNWDHKQQFHNISQTNSSAFTYTPVSPRTLVLRTDRAIGTNKKAMRTTDRSAYYAN